MKEFFIELFRYSNHCNQNLADIFIAKPEMATEKSLKLFSHILNSHNVWNGRIVPPQSQFGVWQIQRVVEFHEIDQLNYEQSLRILETVDLNQIIQYTTTTGLSFTNTVRDILFHVVNHSTYHRAQIATEFKNNGMDPLATDYILYKREE